MTDAPNANESAAPKQPKSEAELYQMLKAAFDQRDSAPPVAIFARALWNLEQIADATQRIAEMMAAESRANVRFGVPIASE
jgi:hypothetical protein